VDKGTPSPCAFGRSQGSHILRVGLGSRVECVPRQRLQRPASTTVPGLCGHARARWLHLQRCPRWPESCLLTLKLLCASMLYCNSVSVLVRLHCFSKLGIQLSALCP